MSRYTVVRRWRNRAATLTVHAAGCSSVRRSEIATFLTAPTPLAASVQASQMFRAEVTVGRSHWGAECSRCTVAH